LVIVDTTVWVDYLGGFDTRYTAWLDEQLERQRLGLTDLILCELLQGIRDDKQAGVGYGFFLEGASTFGTLIH
jgi:predicted nucleic acid-binding protein